MCDAQQQRAADEGGCQVSADGSITLPHHCPRLPVRGEGGSSNNGLDLFHGRACHPITKRAVLCRLLRVLLASAP